ncbi:MAG: D-glycerate dehydrogenase [FCB group bacterium]|jgi:glyoxylate reductase|nr:D-glycerate dehydrogenase [FCB group bacterium]
MTRVLVTRAIPERGLQLLYDAFGKDAVTVAPQDGSMARADLLAAVKGVDALLPMLSDAVNGELMDAAGPQLKVIANYAVGYNNVDVKAATERGIIVTNTPGVLTETTADLAWALLMAAARRIGEGERLTRSGQWAGWGPMQLLGVDVYGKTLGIYGMGRIGQAVARRGLGFGMKVLYTSNRRIDEATEKELNALQVDKDMLLEESDFLSLHMPLTVDTRHCIGAAELAKMKKTAVLVNTARGPVVDEAALAKALQDGVIFAAGLDVFEEEPTIHPELYKCENAVIAPHLGSASLETRSRMAEIAAGNVVRVLRGEEPTTCVNPAVLQG